MKSEVDAAAGARPPPHVGSKHWGPVAEQERIAMLDVLRGVAIFGILLANILIFAFPAQTAGATREPVSGADAATSLFIALLIEGKFYTLFSLLFGMGLALQSARADQHTRQFRVIYLRRISVLFVIGTVHGVFFFAADILAFYAVVALIAIPFRKLAPKTLLATGVALYAAGTLALGAYVTMSPTGAMPADPNWHEVLEMRRAALDEWNDTPAALSANDNPFIVRIIRLLPVAELEFYEFMADEHRIFSSGTFGEMAHHRAATIFLVGMPLKLIFVSWRVLALFLIGMYFVRSSLLTRGDRSPREWKNLALSAFALGMILQLIGGVTQPAMGESVAFTAVALTGILVGTVVLSLSYAAAVALVTATKGGTLLVRAFAAVGRTALTNYLGQSIICAVVFYSLGLGLFGQLEVTEALALTIPIFSVQLIVSTLWLRAFRFGPMEWLWRTLSYGRFQPMRHHP
jgi:uncharacterized protein